MAPPIQTTTTWLRIIGRGIALALLLLLWAGVLAAIFWVVPQSPRFAIPASDQVLAGLSPDGKTLVTLVEGIPGTSGGPLILWDTQNGNKLGTIGNRKNQFRTSVQFSPDGKRMAAREVKEYPNEELLIFDFATLAKQASIDIQTPMRIKPRLCFSPDARLLAFNTKENGEDCLKVWDLATRQMPFTLQGESWHWFFLPDGKTLVIDGTSGGVKFYDVETGQKQFSWLNDMHVREVSADGRFVVTNSLSENNRVTGIRVWELATQDEILALEDEWRPTFVSDGHTFVTEHIDRVSKERRSRSWHRDSDVHHLRFWNLANGKQTNALIVASGPDAWLEAVTAIPGTSYLAVRIRDHLASPGRRQQVKIIDTSTGKELGKIFLWNGHLNQFGISADGKTLAIEELRKTVDLTVEVWDIPPAKSIKWILGLVAVPTVVTALLVWKWWLRKPRQPQPATEAARPG